MTRTQYQKMIESDKAKANEHKPMVIIPIQGAPVTLIDMREAKTLFMAGKIPLKMYLSMVVRMSIDTESK